MKNKAELKHWNSEHLSIIFSNTSISFARFEATLRTSFVYESMVKDLGLQEAACFVQTLEKTHTHNDHVVSDTINATSDWCVWLLCGGGLANPALFECGSVWRQFGGNQLSIT